MAFASPAARGKLPRQGLKGAALDLALDLQAPRQPATPRCLRHLPRYAGEGTVGASRRRDNGRRFPRAAGEAAPTGAEGGALDLALDLQAPPPTATPRCPLPPSAPSPAARGKGQHMFQVAEKGAVASPAQRGKLPQQGLKGAALDLAFDLQAPPPAATPRCPLPPSAPSPAARGKGQHMFQVAEKGAVASPAQRG